MHLPTAGMKCSSMQEHAALLELQGQLRSKHQQRNENIPCNSRKMLDLHDDVPGNEKYSREGAAHLDGGQRLLAVALLHADVHIVLPRVVGLSGVREGICGSTGGFSCRAQSSRSQQQPCGGIQFAAPRVDWAIVRQTVEAR